MHAIQWPDPIKPTAPPTEHDMLAKGRDCCRHPLIGNIISQAGGSPGEQARRYLHSLYVATEQGVAGREYNLSLEEYRQKLRELEEWEKTNTVHMPPPTLPAEFARRR